MYISNAKPSVPSDDEEQAKILGPQSLSEKVPSFALSECLMLMRCFEAEPDGMSGGDKERSPREELPDHGLAGKSNAYMCAISTNGRHRTGTPDTLVSQYPKLRH